MHSRIFQITTQPMPPEDYITEIYFCEHWFVGAVADYVGSIADRYAEIRNFGERLSNLKAAYMGMDNLGNYSFTLLPDGKEAYFTRAYNDFIEARNKSMALSLSEFSSGNEFSHLMWQMQNSYKDEFGVYVSSDEFDTITFDEFIRYAKPGKPYYIGGVLDYHF